MRDWQGDFIMRLGKICRVVRGILMSFKRKVDKTYIVPINW